MERLHRAGHPDEGEIDLESLFPKPKQVSSTTLEGARVKSLQNVKQKMSKSDRSQKGVIYLTDEPGVIEKKVMRAVTDSQGKVGRE